MAKAAEYLPYTGPIVTRAQAKAAGLPRYFTGKPCPHGHAVERITANGTCRLCSNRMAEAAQQANPGKYKALAKAWQWENRDRLNAKARELRKQNPERAKERSMRWVRKNRQYIRDYYAANSEKIRQRAKDWTARNPERARARKLAWGVANADRQKKAYREWAANNPTLTRANKRNYRARKRIADGKHTATEILALLEKQGGKCVYCRKLLKSNYHADHIVPLIEGGSNWISNIQLTCPTCNHRKNRMDPIAFANRMGRLL